MAKFLIEVDTKENTLSVTVNGKVVDDAESVSVYNYKMYEGDEKKVSVNVSTCVKDDSGLRTYISMSASDSEDGKKALTQGKAASEKYPELVVTENKSKVQMDISKLFESYKK